MVAGLPELDYPSDVVRPQMRVTASTGRGPAHGSPANTTCTWMWSRTAADSLTLKSTNSLRRVLWTSRPGEGRRLEEVSELLNVTRERGPFRSPPTGIKLLREIQIESGIFH